MGGCYGYSWGDTGGPVAASLAGEVRISWGPSSRQYIFCGPILCDRKCFHSLTVETFLQHLTLSIRQGVNYIIVLILSEAKYLRLLASAHLSISAASSTGDKWYPCCTWIGIPTAAKNQRAESVVTSTFRRPSWNRRNRDATERGFDLRANQRTRQCTSGRSK
jgi:hypothetical protein